jgi:hypothetical protein
MTGGSDCHQNPIIMGTLDIPAWVAEQFKSHTTRRSTNPKEYYSETNNSEH